jgi:AcrR family transcriptional regulator
MRAEEARDAILDAAATLFDRVGYHHTTIAAIAEQAGTSKAAVIAMFTVKHDILYEIHDRWIDELLTMARDHLRPGAPVHDAIRLCIRDILSVIDSRPSHVRVYFEQYRDLPPDLQKLARAKRDIYEAQVEGVIRRGVETEVLRPRDARVATFALFGITNWAYHWYRADGALTIDEIARELSTIFLHGLSSEPEQDHPERLRSSAMPAEPPH